MTRIFTILCLMSIGFALSAQPGTIAVREANPQSGKILTMEETILSRELAPENLWCTWNGNEDIVMMKNGQAVSFNINTRLEKPYKPVSRKEKIYAKNKSLYYRTDNGLVLTVAKSKDPDITFGEYVSRNEFGINEGIFWAPDSSKVAFYKKDESKVSSFPLLDITTRTGTLKEIKYPMAGMDSEKVELGVYNLLTCKAVYLKVNDFGEDQYLTNISWTPDASKIIVQVLDRSQKHMHMNLYDAVTGTFIKTILTEDNDKYVEPQDPVWFVKGSDNLFIYRTDNRDGYRNLYLCDLKGNVRRIAETDADLAYVGNDGSHIWYTSAEVSPIENHLFRVSIKVPSTAIYKGAEAVKIGKPQQLTTEEGWHDIAMSPDCRHYVDSWSSLNVPRMTNLCTSDGTAIRTMLTADDPTMDYAYTEISLGKVRSADGRFNAAANQAYDRTNCGDFLLAVLLNQLGGKRHEDEHGQEANHHNQAGQRGLAKMGSEHDGVGGGGRLHTQEHTHGSDGAANGGAVAHKSAEGFEQVYLFALGVQLGILVAADGDVLDHI